MHDKAYNVDKINTEVIAYMHFFTCKVVFLLVRKKKVCWTCKIVFLLIRSIFVVFLPFSLFSSCH